jgi:hypothetical protein
MTRARYARRGNSPWSGPYWKVQLAKAPLCFLAPFRAERLFHASVQAFRLQVERFHLLVDLLKRGTILVQPPSVNEPSDQCGIR